MHGARWRANLAAMVVLLAACGGGGSGSTDGGPTSGESGGPPPAGSDFFPLASGNRWIYQITEDGYPGISQVDVAGTTTVAGVSGTTLVTKTLAGTTTDVSRYVSNSNGVTALPVPGDAFSTALGSYALLKLPAQVGTTFVQIDKVLDSGTDEDGDGVTEPVTVVSNVQVVERGPLSTPAGDFADAVHLRTTFDETIVLSHTGARGAVRIVSDDWYVANVGRVRAEAVLTTAGQVVSTRTSVLLAYRAGGTHGGASPAVSSVAPNDGLVHNGAVAVTAFFGFPMDGASLTAGGFSVADASGHVIAGTVVTAQDGLSATFVPSVGWPSGDYTARISASATDRVGNGATPRSWTFTLDTVAPMIAQSSPADGATGVATDAKLSFIFSEPLDPATVMTGSGATFSITDDATGATEPAIAAFDGMFTAGLASRSYWPHDRSFTVRFPAGIGDLVGNTLGVERTVRFTTAASLFNPPVTQTSTPGRPMVTTIADVDGDGRPDVVWTEQDASTFYTHLYVRRGLADGTWAPAIEPIAASVYPCSVYTIAVGDTNADGRSDVVLGGGCGIRVLLQDTSGGFAFGATYSLSGFEYAGTIKLADLNGDGRLDMLTAGGSTAFHVWTQTSSGTFVQTATVDTGLGSLTGVELADLDGDGVIDVVAWSIGALPDRLAILRGLQGGGFGTPSVLPTGNDGWPSSVAIGDLDGDGRLDLAVSIANGVSPRVIVFRQSTAHGFAASDTLPVAYNPFPIGLVDTTRDGRLDIVVGHDDAFSVLRQSNGSFGPEDFYVAPRSSFATWASMAIGPRNAQGAALIAFNGQLFAPRTAMATGQVKSATRLARPYWRPLTQR